MPAGVNVKVKARNEKGATVMDIVSIPKGGMAKVVEALMEQLTSEPAPGNGSKSTPSA